MPLTDDDLNAITNRVGIVIDNRIDQFLTPRQLWQSGSNVWETFIASDGVRCRRRLLPGELVLLRIGSELSEQPFVNVDELAQAQAQAFYSWPEV